MRSSQRDQEKSSGVRVTKKLIIERANEKTFKRGLLGFEKIQVGKSVGKTEREITVWVNCVANQYNGTCHHTARERNFRFPELEKKWLPLAKLLVRSLDILCEEINDLLGYGELEMWESLPDK